MNIAVIGTGGIGGYFGGKLTQLLKDHSDLNIYFIARGAHLSEIRENGLKLESADGTFLCKPTLATDKISDLPMLDLCLLCVKGYDLPVVLPQLKARIDDNTMILPLLNGMDIQERIRTVIKNGIVFPACVYVSSSITEPGKVVQKGNTVIIHFGNDPERRYESQKLFDLFKDAKINFNWHEDPAPQIWTKFIFIASFGLVTTISNKSLGEVMQSEELSRSVKKIMTEINELAKSKKIFLPETIVEDSFNNCANFPFEATTSFQRDYHTPGKTDEREIFGEAAIQLGKKNGIKTDTIESLYHSL